MKPLEAVARADVETLKRLIWAKRLPGQDNRYIIRIGPFYVSTTSANSKVEDCVAELKQTIDDWASDPRSAADE